MKTYAETENELTFNWNEFLDKKEHTQEEMDNAITLSGRWTTCACGNQCSVIPRSYDGEPKDEILSKLGYEFFTCIESEDFERAKRVLRLIDNRSAYLIHKINSKHEN